MSGCAESTAAVRAALAGLDELLPWEDHDGRSWKVDAGAFGRVWTQFEAALTNAAEILRRPQPGQGLAALWLRAVAKTAERLEQEAQSLPCGWRDLLRRRHGQLMWLARDARQLGERFDGGGMATGRITRVVRPGETTLVRLRDLANEWNVEFQRAPREPVDWEAPDVIARWQPWGRRRDQYVLRAGNLLLQALDAAEIDVAHLGLPDASSTVLRSFEAPELLVTALLRRPTPENLAALVDRLEAAGRAGSAGFPAADGADAGVVDDRSMQAYDPPQDYPRDKWVYEHVQCHKFSILSAMFSEACIQKGWRPLTSRNGFKNAADKYADFHHLPHRRFQRGAAKPKN